MVLRQWHQVIKRILFFWMSCAVSVPSSILEHLVLVKGPSVFPSDAEPYQSASKALFVAPRYSDFFLCFIHIFLRRLGVPQRLPPVSGREASAPGGRLRSYSAVFLQRCLWLASKAQTRKAFVSVALRPCSRQPATENQGLPICKGVFVPGTGESRVSRSCAGAVGWGAVAAPAPLGAPHPLAVRVNAHARGWMTSGTVIKGIFCSIYHLRRNWWVAQGQRQALPPKPWGLCGSAQARWAPPGRGGYADLHRLDGTYVLSTECEGTVTVGLLLSLGWQWRHRKYHPYLCLG